MSTDGELDQVLIISLGTEVFALPAMLVRDILEVSEITPLPTASPFVGHLVNVRGRVVPLANLHLRFGLPEITITVDTRMVVLEVTIENEATLVAVLADKVLEVALLDAMVAETIPRIGTRWQPEFAKAIGKRHGQFVMVLNTDRIFDTEDIDPSISPEASRSINNAI
jgi:purine-binding chemotaxis protein CheW